MKTLESSCFINKDDMDFDEAAESALEKRKFLLNRVMQKKLLPDKFDDDKEAEEEVISIIIICKMPHKMNCSNSSPEKDEKSPCRSAYFKRYYAENREGILTWQKRWQAVTITHPLRTIEQLSCLTFPFVNPLLTASAHRRRYPPSMMSPHREDTYSPFYDISHPLDSTFHNDPLLHLTLGSNFLELLLVAILNPNHVTHQFHGLTHLAGWWLVMPHFLKLLSVAILNKPKRRCNPANLAPYILLALHN